MSALVSVIIPTFNRAEYVHSAIQSVLTQTYPFFEVIVIDDGSTDETRSVVAAIHDQRVKYIVTPNKGNYFARNAGLKEARGEFIAFLDSDDRFLPQKLSVQLKCFDRNPDLGMCCANAHIVDRDLPGRLFEDAAHTFGTDFDTQNGFIEKLIQKNFVFTSSVMIRKRCIDAVGLFDTAYQNAMDYDFFLRVAVNFQSLYLKDKLFAKHVHSLNISSNKLNTQRAVIYLLDKAIIHIDSAKLYDPRYKLLIQNARRENMYYLGLEYLSQYDFANAYRCLKESGYQKRKFLKRVALTVAKHRLSFLIAMISFYRKLRQRKSLHCDPSERS